MLLNNENLFEFDKIWKHLKYTCQYVLADVVANFKTFYIKFMITGFCLLKTMLIKHMPPQTPRD